MLILTYLIIYYHFQFLINEYFIYAINEKVNIHHNLLNLDSLLDNFLSVIPTLCYSNQLCCW